MKQQQKDSYWIYLLSVWTCCSAFTFVHLQKKHISLFKPSAVQIALVLFAWLLRHPFISPSCEQFHSPLLYLINQIYLFG